MSEAKGLFGLLLKLLGGGKRRAAAAGPGTSPTRRQQPSPTPKPASPAKRSEGIAVVRREVERWKGVPYKLGGTDRSGIDCSAFARHLCRQAFGRALPRATREQVEEGVEVERSNLEPGDLVFFQISERTRHVGVYLGDGEFAHASSSKGPIVSRLSSDYWKTRYWTSRRIL